jgi:hypothetical protein
MTFDWWPGYLPRTMSERIYRGRIEDGRCSLLVTLGNLGGTRQVWRGPPEAVALDTYSPGITLPHTIVGELGLNPKAMGGGSNGHPAAQTVTVGFRIHDESGGLLYEGRANARVADMGDLPPSLGMNQIIRWRFSIDGPAGTFEVTFPDSSTSSSGASS